jgi:parallel beta-helix repeat protein
MPLVKIVARVVMAFGLFSSLPWDGFQLSRSVLGLCGQCSGAITRKDRQIDSIEGVAKNTDILLGQTDVAYNALPEKEFLGRSVSSSCSFLEIVPPQREFCLRQSTLKKLLEPFQDFASRITEIVSTPKINQRPYAITEMNEGERIFSRGRGFSRMTYADTGADKSKVVEKDSKEISISSFLELLTALRSIGLNRTTLYIKENVSIDTEVNFPSNVFLNFSGAPGMLSPNPGISVTIFSPENIIASQGQQIFANSEGISFDIGGRVHPEWWGATRAGKNPAITRNAMQCAIKAVQGKGGEVLLSGGIYLVDGTIVISQPVTITGTGWNTVVRQSADNISILAQDLTQEQMGLTLQNFQIDANGHGQLNAGVIQINNFAGYLIDHLYVKNGSRHRDSSGVDGIVVSSSSGVAGAKGTIRDCLVENCAKTGIYVNSTPNVIPVPTLVIGNLIRNMKGMGQAQGIGVAGGYVKVIGNTVYNCEGRGISIGPVGSSGSASISRGTVVQGNQVFDCGTGSVVGDGIACVNGLNEPDHFVIIDGNFCFRNGVASGTSAHGILIQNSNGVIVSNNILRNNHVFGISIDSSKDINVSNNQCISNNQAKVANGGGIGIRSVHNGIITNNLCTDDQASKTQEYGISFFQSEKGISNLIIAFNLLSGNKINAMLKNDLAMGSEFTGNKVNGHKIP